MFLIINGADKNKIMAFLKKDFSENCKQAIT
jgi:hypothetical protein